MEHDEYVVNGSGYIHHGCNVKCIIFNNTYYEGNKETLTRFLNLAYKFRSSPAASDREFLNYSYLIPLAEEYLNNYDLNLSKKKFKSNLIFTIILIVEFIVLSYFIYLKYTYTLTNTLDSLLISAHLLYFVVANVLVILATIFFKLEYYFLFQLMGILIAIGSVLMFPFILLG